MFKRLFLPCNAKASFPARPQLLERRAGMPALCVLLSILRGDKSAVWGKSSAGAHPTVLPILQNPGSCSLCKPLFCCEPLTEVSLWDRALARLEVPCSEPITSLAIPITSAPILLWGVLSDLAAASLQFKWGLAVTHLPLFQRLALRFLHNSSSHNTCKLSE